MTNTEQEILCYNTQGALCLLDFGKTRFTENNWSVAIVKIILKYLRPFYARMFLGLLIKFLGTIMDLILPYILAHIIDHVVPTKNISMVLLWGCIMIICSLCGMFGNVIANRMASKVARDTSESIRHDLFAKIFYLSSKQIDGFSVASLESRLTSDTYNIHNMLGGMQRLGVRAPILLIGGIIVTLTLEPVLALVLVSVLPFIAFAVWHISRKGIPLYTKLQKAVDKMVRVVRENAQGVRVIKALSKTDYEKRRFGTVNNEVVGCEKKAGYAMAASNPVMNLFLNAGLVLVVLVGAYRVNGGTSEAGKIIAFLTYFTLISNAMLSITRMFVMFSKGTASANRVGEVLHTSEDLQTFPAEEETRKNDDYIVFDHVFFSYNGKKNNLTDISFSIPKGKMLGIIGATGSGKSTVIQLLMRFYDVSSGEIRIGGQDVRTIPPDKLHLKFGVVMQNDFLYADTIEENIRFGRDLSHEQIVRAATLSQAIGFITKLEDGFQHMLTAKGTNLSGGQKQRLLIARALAASPDILIMDDSSSALDYKTDAELRKAIKGSFSGATTTIVIAQRISTVMSADEIIVLEKGKIQGKGTHEELMDSCEIYREIGHSQMGGALVG